MDERCHWDEFREWEDVEISREEATRIWDIIVMALKGLSGTAGLQSFPGTEMEIEYERSLLDHKEAVTISVIPQ